MPRQQATLRRSGFEHPQEGFAAKDVGGHTVAILQTVGVELGPGLTDAEFDEIAAQYGVEFNPDHRSLLATALPHGDRWPDWRDGGGTRLRLFLDQAASGPVFDALHQDPPFWDASWGLSPTTAADIASVVLREFAKMAAPRTHLRTSNDTCSSVTFRDPDT